MFSSLPTLPAPLMRLLATQRGRAWQQACVQLMNWMAVASELHRDWRNDIEGLGKLLSGHLPSCRNLITSYTTKKPVG